MARLSSSELLAVLRGRPLQAEELNRELPLVICNLFLFKVDENMLMHCSLLQSFINFLYHIYGLQLALVRTQLST
jgi:hypothetical protein